MSLVWRGFALWLICFHSLLADVQAQCSALRPQIDISFNTDQDCAPVTVTQYAITYYFNASQDPNEIEIIYEWNDPANTVDIIYIAAHICQNLLKQYTYFSRQHRSLKH